MTKFPVLYSDTQKSFDMVFRVTGVSDENSLKYCNLTAIDTKSIESRFKATRSNFEFTISVLREVVISQKKLLDYNGIYSAYLMNHISEDDFYEEAEKYSYDPLEVDPQELANKISCLFEETGIEYAESELKSLFNCSESSLKESLVAVIKNKSFFNKPTGKFTGVFHNESSL